jgi:hypothetical protein
MESSNFKEADHLAWGRFMLLNVFALSIAWAREHDGDPDAYLAFMRERMADAWRGLGAQGVEGAMLGSTLTVESIGSEIRSTQASPESSEIVTEPIPGQTALDGMRERFDVDLSAAEWYELLGISEADANRIYDILGAVADGAEIEYARETESDGNVRISLRAW